MNTQKKQMTMIVLFVVVFALVGYFVTRESTESETNSRKGSTLPKTQSAPTVDSSVIVTLKADPKKENALLSVSAAPKGTTEIYYEFSYDALIDGETVSRGVVGNLDMKGDDAVDSSITIGTCSSGTCKYDKGVSSVHLFLRFSGSYGEQVFEKDFELK